MALKGGIAAHKDDGRVFTCMHVTQVYHASEEARLFEVVKKSGVGHFGCRQHSGLQKTAGTVYNVYIQKSAAVTDIAIRFVFY